MVDKLDRQVGAIVDQVRKLGLDKRTIIISVPTTGMNFTTVQIKAAAAGPTATEASWTAPGNCWMFSAAAAAALGQTTPWPIWPD